MPVLLLRAVVGPWCRRAVAVALALALVACGGRGVREDARAPDEFLRPPEASVARFVAVRERWISAALPETAVLDSPAAWVAPDGRVQVLVSAKGGQWIQRFDGATGAVLDAVGGPDRFAHPNGLSVFGDRLLVVERDRARVQVLSLPELAPLAQFGEDVLRSPYGLWVHEFAPDRLEVLVTDSDMLPPPVPGARPVVPPLPALAQRIKRFAVEDIDTDAPQARLLGSFGDTGEAGALRMVESIWGDLQHDRLLIAEEDDQTGAALRVYDMAGRYTGRDVGAGVYQAQAEGIALWACGDGSGYWIGVDQFPDRTVFRVFDRESLDYLGAFAGATTANTDGIWLHAASSEAFPRGVLYAVHDDRALAAFDWRDIAAALELRADCD